MKKLVKFTTKEVVKEVEKEIELPAYFCNGSGRPSVSGYGEYFGVIMKISDPEKQGVMITSSHNLSGDEVNTYTFGGSCFSNSEVMSGSNFTQVAESEWLKAVEYVKRDIDN